VKKKKHEDQFKKKYLRMKMKKINLKKKHLKEYQSQFVLTFKTCDFVHEARTDRIEGKPKTTTNQDS
jgi:hypothetical protein